MPIRSDALFRKKRLELSIKSTKRIESILDENLPSLLLIQELCNRLREELITWSDEYSQLARYPQKLRQHTHAMLLDSFKKLKQAELNCYDEIQTHTLEIARSALSFSVLRNRQIFAVNNGTGDANILLRMNRIRFRKRGIVR